MTPQALPLEPVPTTPLIEAYQRAGYAKRGITLAQAQANKVLSICLRCYAEAIIKARKA